MTDQARIVVGFDGSPCSVQAANWAVAQATLDGSQVVLCHVGRYRRPPGQGEGGDEDTVASAADRLLADGIRHARARAPGVDVVPAAVSGHPARELIDVASGAALLVVGMRGAGGPQEFRLGSVSAQTARHAHCTVVIVPDAGDHIDKDRRRVVVVGVDGSSSSHLALTFAFEQAARRQAELRAIHVFDAATIQIMANLPQDDLRRLHVTAADTLHGLLSTHARHHPGVRVSSAVLSGAPASTLTAAAADAELLVLGSRGHGDVATLMLGSTSHTVLHNATCPVAVVRGEPRFHPVPAGRLPAQRRSHAVRSAAETASHEERTVTDALSALAERGVSVWLDDLNRDRLTSGSLAGLVAHDHVVGVTTNPAIFAKAITAGEAYDDQVRSLAVRGVDTGEALRALTTRDVRDACDVLRPVYDATSGVDGRVSIEVDPRLAHDTDATVAEAEALWWAIDRPNLFIKIPAARQTLPAITTCLAEGISINVTLIFSLDRYDAVMDAFLDGIEQARHAGHDLSPIGSVASFFVSRVDTEVDARLDKIGTAAAAELRGRAAIANARLAYQRHERVFSSPRWEALQAAGARPQRPLWASTSVKDPAYSDTRYVVGLVADGVVNTMPETTLRAVADHGRVPDDSIHAHYDDAQRVLDRLRRIGVDYDDVVRTLENDGVAAFEASWDQLSEQLAERMRAHAAHRHTR
jgi:transaldolase